MTRAHPANEEEEEEEDLFYQFQFWNLLFRFTSIQFKPGKNRLICFLLERAGCSLLSFSPL